jgi:tRNA pseudouridine32 synthase/23S rRNA pseudouridine746 synthase
MPVPDGLRILADFKTFAVIEKPRGLLSVPGIVEKDCVSERFKKLFPQSIPHPSVHRLDWETSGILVLAKTKESHRDISIQFQDRKTSKRYIAVVDGVVEAAAGRIELPFRLNVENRPYQIYDEDHGKIGISLWKNLSVEAGCTRIEYTPITGRTHQLRLHSMHSKGLGFPIVGDCLYGTGTDVFHMKLHASYLKFKNPENDEMLEFNSEAPF